MKFSRAKENYYKNIKKLLTIEVNSDLNSDINLDNDNDSPATLMQISICEKCLINSYKYTCPKCKIKYCNLTCYKTHNLECTEEFYKTNVIEELKSDKTNSDEVKKFRKNLKDVYEKMNVDKNFKKNNFISEMREKHYENILDKLENGSFEFNRDLIPQDWEEFEKFLNIMNNNHDEINFNEINKEDVVDNENYLLNIWKPFWEQKIYTEFEPSLEIYDSELLKNLNEKTLQKIKEIEINNLIIIDTNNSNNYELEINNMEDLLNLDFENINLSQNLNYNLIYKSILLKYLDIPNLSKITKIKPNNSNFYSLCNILINTIFIFRLYNGEVNENLEEIVQFLLEENCKVLYDKNIIFEDLKSCLNYLFDKIKIFLEPGFKDSKKLFINDLKNLVKNKFYIFESLVRIYEILHRFSLVNNYDKEKNLDKNFMKRIVLAKHKIIYFMSYIKNLDKEFIYERIEEINLYN